MMRAWWAGSLLVPSMIAWEKPWILVSGVRRSWETFARKSCWASLGRLDLGRHVVEGRRHVADLVRAGDGHALLVMARRDLARRLAQAEQRAQDALAGEPGHHQGHDQPGRPGLQQGDQDRRPEQAQHLPPRGFGARRGEEQQGVRLARLDAVADEQPLLAALDEAALHPSGRARRAWRSLRPQLEVHPLPAGEHPQRIVDDRAVRLGGDHARVGVGGHAIEGGFQAGRGGVDQQPGDQLALGDAVGEDG